ncbi:MAG: AAA family ATPase [Muribaculaceae bacterium]|nr:AAA family ATPase [Muribaculaceae bacterium]
MDSAFNNIDLDNPEFQQAYRLLEQTNANVFLTGKAGTGKSTFLKYICKKLAKKYVVLAPTGVAAVNVAGVTIHSFFQMPLRPVPPDDPDYSVSIFKSPKKFSRKKRKLIKELELIIIDEVSMVRPDMIDFIDRVLRGVTGRRGKPFGGIQLLLVGDIFQLEPVVNADTRLILSKYYTNFFFFNALVYNSANLISIELKKIYRQSDPVFIGILDRLRINHTTVDDIRKLNSEVRENKCNNDEFGITLTTRRDLASVINKEKMDSLPEEEFVFKGEIIDDFPEKLLPTDLNLILKKDAQVMLIRNDKDRRWVNGSLAKITEINSTSISIRLENGMEEKLEREIWNNITYSYDEKEKKVKEEILGQFIQYPVRAAWALTIHKSQGLTFNNVAIDMSGGAFSAGQTYVALSRCRSLEGITFLNPISRRDIIVSRGAKMFSEEFNDKRKIDDALKESLARQHSLDAVHEFDQENYRAAIDSLWNVHENAGVLEKSSVRRFIAHKLNIISRLKNDNKRMEAKLKELSKEYVILGNISLHEGNDVRSAQKNFIKACDLDAGNMDAKMGEAECFIINGDYEEAFSVLREVQKKDRKMTYRVLMCRGRIYEKTGDLPAALLAYTSAFKKNRTDKEPVEKIISIYEKMGMEGEADNYRDWLRENLS